MEILTSLRNDKIYEKTAVTVGKFDGIHKGHELLTKKLREHQAKGLAPLVLTFDVSPRLFLGKDTQKQLITTQERIELIRKEGASYLAICSFENEIKDLEPEEFIELLCINYQMNYLVCGTDFRFGKMGKGDITLLRKLAEEYDFELEVVDKLKQENRDISSTYVREEIAKGNVALGYELLGYPYFIWGEVVHGRHLGTKIGIPTINLVPPEDKLLPANGVYATKVEIEHKTYFGVTNVGVKPTIEGERNVGVETHILNFSEDVYAKQAKVSFLSRIREEQKFESIEELASQMKRDCENAKEYFNKK